MKRVLASLLLSVTLSALGGEMSGDRQEADSARYQLIKVSTAMPPPGRWDKVHERLVIDLLAFKDRLDTMPEPARRRLAQLTADFTRSVLLRDALARDDVVYFSDYWTRKDSVLKIVEYRKAGSASDLTSYLGPLSAIPTSSFGLARYHFRYKDEVLPFWGVAQKEKWSLRARYWAHAQVFMPFDESAGLDVAVIGMQLGANHMEAVGTFMLLPAAAP